MSTHLSSCYFHFDYKTYILLITLYTLNQLKPITPTATSHQCIFFYPFPLATFIPLFHPHNLTVLCSFLLDFIR